MPGTLRLSQSALPNAKQDNLQCSPSVLNIRCLLVPVRTAAVASGFSTESAEAPAKCMASGGVHHDPILALLWPSLVPGTKEAIYKLALLCVLYTKGY